LPPRVSSKAKRTEESPIEVGQDEMSHDAISHDDIPPEDLPPDIPNLHAPPDPMLAVAIEADHETENMLHETQDAERYSPDTPDNGEEMVDEEGDTPVEDSVGEDGEGESADDGSSEGDETEDSADERPDSELSRDFSASHQPQGIPPQARIRALMSIPDNQKTEAQWDELIELEIAMAQGGRLLNLPPKQHKPHGKPNPYNKPGGQKKPGGGGGMNNGGQRPQQNGSAPQENGGGGNKPHGGQNKKHGRRFFKKPGKPAQGGNT